MFFSDRGPVYETEEERRSVMEWLEKEDLKKITLENSKSFRTNCRCFNP
jgi:hypothetical protein